MPNDEACDPDEGEMDIMEMINGDGTSYSTYHWQTTYPARNCSYPTGHEHVYAGVSSSPSAPSAQSSGKRVRLCTLDGVHFLLSASTFFLCFSLRI